MENTFKWLLDLIPLIIRFGKGIQSLLSYQFNVGSYTFSIFEAVLGGGFVLLLSLLLVKALIPVA